MVLVHVIYLFIPGVISSNGDSGVNGSGGASGGSIWVTTDNLYGSGIIQANGGSG